MNEELQKYIEALRRHANNARYVQLRLSDGNLTSPMSIEDAAAYIYSDNKPQTKTLPSEQVAAQQDRQWAAREAARQADQARTRANEYNTRTFYTDVALPTITLGLSKFIPGLEGTANSVTDPLLASSLAVSKSPVGKLFLPAATAAAAWSWYANTHRVPDFRLRTESPEWDYDAGWDIPEDYVPATATNVGSTQPVSPAASQAVDETVSRSNEQELSPSSQPEQNNDENPSQEPEQKPNKPKKPSKVKEEAKKVGLDIVPFSAGFFVTVPCSDPDALAEELKKKNAFVIPLATGGIRISVASSSEAKCRKLPGLIKEAMENLGMQ